MTRHRVVPSHSTVVLDRDVRAPRQVRRVIHDMCARSALPAQTVDNAMFVASALVTTSVRHAQGPLRMDVDVDDDNVTVRVRYSAAQRPTSSGRPAVGALRSWDVIKRLSRSFGYTSTGTDHEVWVNLSTEPSPSTSRRLRHGAHTCPVVDRP